MGIQPNQRAQDGIKRPWLCSPCETVLSRLERSFATKLFHPYLKESGKRFHYENWLIHFCISLSWRVLHFYIKEGTISNYSPQVIEQMKRAEAVWRDVLLGRRPHPGEHQQHILPVDFIRSVQGGGLQGGLASNVNRYLARAIDMDLCQGNKTIYTYAKLGRFIILGFVAEPEPNRWRGTKVSASQGTIEPKSYVLPAALLGYINAKAKGMQALLENMSEQQHKKVDEAFQKNIDKYVGSDAHDAMRADVEMFGGAAFSRRTQEDQER
ncbi:MAG: hypothetical protein JO142_18415 [Burkholderiales bacterium]|nr:hypothetical protein [Burkholderiales bacterium]